MPEVVLGRPERLPTDRGRLPSSLVEPPARSTDMQEPDVVVIGQRLSIEVQQHGSSVARVRVVGEIDLSAQAALLENLEPICAQPEVHVELDLSEITFIDSSGLGVLVKLQRLTDAATGRLAVVNPSAQVVRLLDLTGLDQVLMVIEL